MYTSSGTRRRSLPSSVQCRSFSPLSPIQQHPGTVPAGALRGCGNRRTSEPQDSSVTSAPPGDLKAVEREEWVKTTWKKGERREEIKLTAEASGLAFDDASMVTLRLYNHFNWLSQLQRRSEQLSGMIGRERRLSLSLARKEILAPAARDLCEDRAASSVGNGGTREAQEEETDEDFGGTAGDGGGEAQFNRYVRGLCMVCNEGGFDQILDVLFRTYSRATGGRTITRTEMAAILAKHVMYEELKDPTIAKERVYRWLKRQFIDLTASNSPAAALRNAAGGMQGCGAAAASTSGPAGSCAVAEARRDQDGGFISWDTARELLRQAPFSLENCLAIDLPCLSKDLWTADLVDVGRTSISSSLE